MLNNHEAVVNAFYLAYYGRPADPAGLAFWSAQLERSNGDFGSIIDFFSTSAEATSRFGEDTAAERIATIYEQLFGRAPDAAGLQFWVDAIEAGHTTVAAVAVEVLKGAQHDDLVVSNLRQQAAADFTALVAQDTSIDFTGNAAIEASRALVAAVDADTTPDSLAAMVKVAAGLVDIAHDTPAVVAALGGDLAALFATARGQAEPENLLRALADIARAAAGEPATLDSLLRGGGMAKVLDVMPASATLQNVVDALARGGLPAAVEVVYPSAPEAVLNIGFAAGKLTLAGDALYDALVDLDAHTVTYNGIKTTIAGDMTGIVAKDYPGKVTVQGTAAELTAVLPLSLGHDAYRVADAKSALFTGPAEARTLVPGAIALLKGAELVTLSDTLSAAEHDLLRTLDGFDIARLHADTDSLAPAAGTLHASGVDLSVLDPITNHDAFTLSLDGAETGAAVRYQVRAQGQDGWTDLPSAALSGLQDGVYSYRGVVMDAAGNVSHTDAVTLTVDTTVPTLGAIAFGQNDGALALGESVELSVAFSEAVFVNGVPTLKLNNGGTATYVSGGGSDKLVFKYTPAAGQDIGSLKLAATDPFAGTVTDRAGNALAAGAFDGQPVEGSVAVDTGVPAQTFIFGRISQSSGTSINMSGNNDPLQTNLASATVRAALSAALGQDEHVEYSLDGGLTWSTQQITVNGTGVMVDGVATTASPTMQLRVVDAAGNAGPSSSRAIVYDTQAPGAVPLVFESVQEGPYDSQPDNVTNVDFAVVTFLLDGASFVAGDRIQFSINGVQWSSSNTVLPVDGRVNFSTSLSNGQLGADGNRTTTVQVRVMDAAGNFTLLGSKELVYDGHAEAPTLVLDTDSAGKYGSADDGITNVGTFHAVGIEAGGHAEYSLTGTGNWSATAPVAAQGVNTVWVRQVDAAGNTSTSTSLSFTLDSGVPLAPTVGLVSDTGFYASDKVTQVGDVSVGGLETAAGTVWEYSLDGGTNWTQGGAISAQGKSSLSVTDDGSHTVLVRQYDAAGNMSGNGTLAFTLDREAPVLAFDHVEGATDAVKNATSLGSADVVFSYTGDLGPDDEVQVQVGAGGFASYGTVDRDAHTITLPDFNLTTADPTIQVRVADPAGNVSNTVTVTIDGPYSPPSVATTASAAGVTVTSTVAGTLWMVAPGGSSSQLTIGGAPVSVQAGTPYLLGATDGIAYGMVAVKTADGTLVVESANTHNYVLGTNSDDLWSSFPNITSRDNIMWGFDGRDNFYYGLSGNDTLYGGGGDDTVAGRDGDDYINGGAGSNVLNGGLGADRIDITQGQNRLTYLPTENLQSGLDVVTFAAAPGGNTAPQTFDFANDMVYMGPRQNGAANPVDGSIAALVAALTMPYYDAVGTTEFSAVVVQFANQDTYLVADTGNGIVDASDHIVKLVGYLPYMQLVSGNVVFSSPS